MARTSANYIGPFSTNSLISMYIVYGQCLRSIAEKWLNLLQKLRNLLQDIEIAREKEGKVVWILYIKK
jgi:hypothetical protein